MIQINLSDWRNRKQQRQLELISVVVILLFVVTTTGYLLFLNALKSENQNIQHHILQHQQTIQSTTLQLNLAKRQQTVLNWLEMQYNEAEQLANEQDTLLQFLHSISKDIPHDLWLTKLTHNEKGLVIEGNAFTYESITQFSSLLNHYPFTRQLNLEHINAFPPESYLSFRLEEK